jgi:hypothetical protein
MEPVLHCFAARTVTRPLLVSMTAFAFAASPMVMVFVPAFVTTSPPERSIFPLLVSAVTVLCRIDTLDELDYYKNGGIMPYVLRNLAKAG